ncbi:MAG: hypothetical protein KF780_13755 [Sphingomonas sp.]|nr:hypothetical protein [Sphingomonas sp.]
MLAVLAGVNLGNAAVEGINPAYYATPAAPRPRVAPEAPYPATLARQTPSYGELYGWDAGEMARTVACGEACDEDGGYSAHVPYFGSREELAEAQRAARTAIDDAFAKADADARKPAPAEPLLVEDAVADDDQE